MNASKTTTSQVARALAGWCAGLGADAVWSDADALDGYQLNTSEFSPREVVAVLVPSSVDDVREIIAVARSAAVAVHPLSTGRNWGFGSALPVRGPVALVDLRRMNQILEIDSRFRFGVIEPGVTQGRLADHLLARGGTLKLNVTGAGPDTSIVGNVLDHGLGNLGSRGDDLLGLEVVLGNGDVVRTGLWHFGSSKKAIAHFPPGLGPDLRGLFVQSSFGIVTKMVVRLHPVAALLEMTVEVAPEKLAELVDELRVEREDGLVTGYLRIVDDADPNIRFFGGSENPVWRAQLTVRGTAGMRAQARRELEQRLRPLAVSVDAFDSEYDDLEDQQGDESAMLEARLRLAGGLPSYRSLERLASAAGKSFVNGSADLDRDRDLPGFLCVNVSLPFAGESVVSCSEVVRAVSEEAGVGISKFFGMSGPAALSGFFPFYFDRRSGREVTRAHWMKDELLRRLETRGIYPMRLDVDSMGEFIERTYDGHWRAVLAIKQALDPDGIISPGRYCVADHPQAAHDAASASTTVRPELWTERGAVR